MHLAQEMFVEQGICAAYMTQTDCYLYSAQDKWYYLSESYVRMGEDFANAYIELVGRCR